MPSRQQIIAILINIGFLAVILEMVRKRKIMEQFSIIWLVLLGMMFLFGIWHEALIVVTKWIGAGFTSSTLFFFGILVCLMLSFQTSIHLSRNARAIKNLTQEVALIRFQLERWETSSDEGRDGIGRTGNTA